MATCGEALIDILEAYGVQNVFGIPGVHTVELYRGLASSPIRHITPRHEQGAGFMADGYARASGKPGVCFIITGPGMTNIATAMGQAYGDSIPMLVISSVNETQNLGLGQGRLHELTSQRGLVSHVAAFSHTLLHPGELPQVMARAFAVFESARPRPVHIEIPIDVMKADAGEIDLSKWAIPEAPAPAASALAAAANALEGAQTPLVLLGGGAADARDSVVDLVEYLDAPTIATVNAKGILKPDHALHGGSNTGFPSLWSAVHDADVVLAVGTEIGETDRYPDRRLLEFGGTFIRIDIDPEQLMRNGVPDISIVADADAACTALLETLRATGRNSLASAGQGAARAAQMREAVRADWWPGCANYEPVMAAVQEALPGALIVGDSTQPVYNANQFYQPEQPRSFFNSSTGYGTLGFALPAAIGAKLAMPDRPVVCLIGDGGIQFTLPEMASAVEAKAPIVILLWNNFGYGEIKNYMVENGIQPEGVDLFTPDFEPISKGFGFAFERAHDLSQLKEALTRAHSTGKHTVVEILQDEVFDRSFAVKPGWD